MATPKEPCVFYQVDELTRGTYGCEGRGCKRTPKEQPKCNEYQRLATSPISSRIYVACIRKALELAGLVDPTQKESPLSIVMEANLTGLGNAGWGKEEDARILKMVRAGLSHIKAWTAKEESAN